MRRLNVLTSLGVITMALALAVIGCAQKQTASESTTDSLLASNPQETPSGNINPQSSYQQQQSHPSQTAPPRRSAPAPTRTIPTGTPISVSVHTPISSHPEDLGDTWTGTVERP